jgi:hypothetical protein
LPPFGPAIRLPQQKPALSCRGPMVRIHLPPSGESRANPSSACRLASLVFRSALTRVVISRCRATPGPTASWASASTCDGPLCHLDRSGLRDQASTPSGQWRGVWASHRTRRRSREPSAKMQGPALWSTCFKTRQGSRRQAPRPRKPPEDAFYGNTRPSLLPSLLVLRAGPRYRQCRQQAPSAYGAWRVVDVDQVIIRIGEERRSAVRRGEL